MSEGDEMSQDKHATILAASEGWEEDAIERRWRLLL